MNKILQKNNKLTKNNNPIKGMKNYDNLVKVIKMILIINMNIQYLLEDNNNSKLQKYSKIIVISLKNKINNL